MLKGNIPAPQEVYYDGSSGIVRWKSPLNNEDILGVNITSDFRITHYIIYVTDTQTEVTHMGSVTEMTYFVGNLNLSCNFIIQVSAVNPSSEGIRSTNITVDSKLFIMDSYII